MKAKIFDDYDNDDDDDDDEEDDGNILSCKAMVFCTYSQLNCSVCNCGCTVLIEIGRRDRHLLQM